MKKLTLTLVSAFLLLVVLSGCKKDVLTRGGNSSAILTQQEQDDLMFLREEEKLARDVYLFSFDKYGTSIFNNIAQSEQTHMDKVLTLLQKYNLPDLASTQRGVFNNQTLQTLYDDLTAQSNISLIEALKVGATIEDLDINDIEEFESHTYAADLLNVYDKLRCGSRNHLRSFSSQLTANNETYTPQFITNTEYQAIISSPNEKCGN